MSGLFKLCCPFHAQGCSQRFRSQAGRTNHVRTFHTNPNVILPLPSSEDEDDQGSIQEDPNLSPVPPSPIYSPVTSPQVPDPTIETPFISKPTRNYHPHLTGML